MGKYGKIWETYGKKWENVDFTSFECGMWHGFVPRNSEMMTWNMLEPPLGSEASQQGKVRDTLLHLACNDEDDEVQNEVL